MDEGHCYRSKTMSVCITVIEEEDEQDYDGFNKGSEQNSGTVIDPDCTVHVPKKTTKLATRIKKTIYGSSVAK